MFPTLIVILKHVLHHVQYPEIVLKKVNRILTKNGVVIISEPNLSSVIGNLLKWFLDYFFKISMEASPYGQYSQTKINNSSCNIFWNIWLRTYWDDI